MRGFVLFVYVIVILMIYMVPFIMFCTELWTCIVWGFFAAAFSYAISKPTNKIAIWANAK